MKNEVKHTAHSSYRCEYHIVFAPKYRRRVVYKELKKDIGDIIRKLCAEMKVEIEYAIKYLDVAQKYNRGDLTHQMQKVDARIQSMLDPDKSLTESYTNFSYL